ncbi:hypothetical protein BJ878DRAFT_404377, partial [Calycina marina]
PDDLYEHVAHLSQYLGNIPLCIEDAKEPSILDPLMKTLIAAMCSTLTKIENMPDNETIMQALKTLQDDLRTTNAMKIVAETVQTTA